MKSDTEKTVKNSRSYYSLFARLDTNYMKDAEKENFMEGKGFIKLRISGQDLNFEEITKTLSRQPSFTYHKGDAYTPKFGDKKPIIYKEDCWLFEEALQTGKPLDEAVYAFAAQFEKSKTYLKEAAATNDITLVLSLYPDDEQSNILLMNKTLALLSDMGLSVSVDIMFLKEFYEGTYTK